MLLLERLPWLIVASVIVACAILQWRSHHEVGALREQVATARLQAEQKAREQIARAAQAADAAVLDAQQRASRAEQNAHHLRQELARVASDRPCLSAATRSVLERHPAFAASVPARAVLPDRAASAAAADSGQPEQPAEHAVSTERDMAEWALQVSTLYDTCRARIDAIRQWDAHANPPASR